MYRHEAFDPYDAKHADAEGGNQHWPQGFPCAADGAGQDFDQHISDVKRHERAQDLQPQFQHVAVVGEQQVYVLSGQQQDSREQDRDGKRHHQ